MRHERRCNFELVSLHVVKIYYIDEEDHTMSVRSSTFGGETVNSYEVDTIEVDIITDFGADAPTFP